MLAQLVLVTRLLGLVSGEQPIEVRVDASVRRVELVRDGKSAGTLRGAPWRTVLDFGPELAPHELLAIAYDANGVEVGRDAQLVNLARPPAEVQLSIDRDAKSGRLRANVRWQHIGAAAPKRVEVKLDGKTIGETAVVPLPAAAGNSMHVLEAEVEFPGSVIAKKELVFGGLYFEELPSELSSVLVRRREDGGGKTDLANCFRVGGREVPTAGLEKVDAVVQFVRGSSPVLAEKVLRLPAVPSHTTGVMMLRAYRLANAQLRFMWPTAESVRGSDTESITNLFLQSGVADGVRGTHWMLTLIEGPPTTSQRFADATAVAGVQALRPRRRAVVVVLGGERDDSRYEPQVVRRYLERIGVPLRVWSLLRVTPGVKAAWGDDIMEITNADKLREATDELRGELERQRIAWLPVSQLDALRVEGTPDCEWVPVAQP